MKKLVVTVCIQLLFFGAMAQEIAKDTIQWKSSSFINLKNKEEVSFNCVLQSYGVNKIEWIQNNGDDVYVFSILEKDNAWNSLGTNGKTTFKVEYDGKAGEIIIEEDESRISIILDLRKGDPDGGAFKFIITTISVLSN